MGRNSKYSREIKIETAKSYLNGKRSVINLASELSVNKTTIRRWIAEYKKYGDNAFKARPTNKAYSKELKEEAIQAYLNGEGSYRSIALKYGITADTILIKWVKKYNRHEPIKDYNPKGDVYMNKRRKTTLEEIIEIVKRCIKQNNDYKGTAELYDVSYAQVYNWVRKYNDFGEEGLIDGRGKKKIESSLTEVERLERKIKQLERELELKERETIVLKKLKEVERRRYSPDQNKKRST